tara:strand:- start:114 stop:740 length:627 start_codon:yes stop_codon:yes gene_type:complete
MAYINITGDSDGDLHDASLHNNKFGAIASVLNGNIDRENLANPHSIYTMTFEGGPGAQPVASVLSETWVTISSSSSPNITANTHSNAGSARQCLMPSWTKINNASTLIAAHLTFVAGSGPGSSSTPTGVLQKSSAIDGVYSTVASTSGTLQLYDASAAQVIDVNALSISSSGISAGEYIRFIWANPAANPQYPPKMTLTLTFKSEHVS